MTLPELMAFVVLARHFYATDIIDLLTVEDFPHLNANERKKIVKHVKSFMLPRDVYKSHGNKLKLSNKELFELLSGVAR